MVWDYEAIKNFTPPSISVRELRLALLAFPTLAARRVAHILFSEDEEPWELMLALTALLWGLWVAAPWWDALGDSMTLLQLDYARPVVGLFVVGIGLLRFVLLVSSARRWRHWFAIVSLCTWFFLWFSSVTSNPASTSTVLYLLPLGASLLVFIRLGRP